MSEQPDREAEPPPLVLGYVAGAHGVHGTVRVHLHDRGSDALASGRRVTLRPEGGAAVEHEIESVADVPGKPQRRRVGLVGVADRNAAEALRGCTVIMQRDQLPPLAEDEFYLADAIGLPVERERDGAVQSLGTIVGLASNGVQDLFEVQWRDSGGRSRPWLLPMLPDHVVDIDEHRVRVDLPLGLLPDGLEDPQ